MELLADLKLSLLNLYFVMIYFLNKIYKMLVLLKNHLNYLKIVFLNAFLRSIIGFFLTKMFFFTTNNDGKFKS